MVVFLVDARAGLTAADETIAERLRRSGKPVLTAVNKAEGMESQLASAEFQSLGFEHCESISAAHGQRIRSLVSVALETRELVKCYGSTRALDGLNLRIPQGSLFGLVGHNRREAIHKITR